MLTTKAWSGLLYCWCSHFWNGWMCPLQNCRYFISITKLLSWALVKVLLFQFFDYSIYLELFQLVVMNDTLCSTISTCSWCLYCCCYRYLENNIRCLETVRAYDATVPEFLRNWPRRLVNHCIRRLPPSVEEIPSHCVTVVAENTYMVRSKDRLYQVSCSDSLASCECIDWQLNFMPCKK